ncbi:MAG: M48 family metallopeptidase [Leptonema sp. (in: Bacteria)]|nr:M48 family metallopeptidase [Leptonema sp. (in: bacteria)]
MQRKAAFKWGPILLALVSIAFFYFKSETFQNPITGRETRLGMSKQEEVALGLQGYQEVLSQSQVVQSGPDVELVKKVAQRLVNVVGSEGEGFDWQVSLVQSNEVNAFCLPGGKIVVYTGILPVAQNEAGLATVMGHEIAHATSRHGAERMYDQGMVDIAMKGVQGSIEDLDVSQQKTVLGIIGAGAQYGVLLPFSRNHELEADEVGLYYMMKAGYNPNEAVEFWKRMAAIGDQKPPEFSSTHPSDETRFRRLQELIPKIRQKIGQ